MKIGLKPVAAVVVLLFVGACAAQQSEVPVAEQEAKPKPATMSGDELAKEFGKGSKVCAWTSADGKRKGEDYYYKNETALSGDMDRNVGDDTIQGSWKIAGSGFWIKEGTDKKTRGTWMNLAKVGKKTYVAYDSSQNEVMTMKCQ